jgi:HD-like signal output (HDOD) protein
LHLRYKQKPQRDIFDMRRTLEELASQLAPLPLPVMPTAVERYRGLTQKTSCTNLDYQQAIEQDPGFALMVLRQSGEALPEDHDPIRNIAHGFSLLGLGKVDQSIAGLPTISAESHTEANSLLECYSRATHAASYALEMGLLNKDHDPHELAISALLFESAEMSLRFHQPEVMESLNRLIEHGEEQNAAANQVLGGTLNELSLALARQWRLPMLILDALRPFGNLNRRALGVMLAVELARSTRGNWFSEQTSDLLELCAEYLRIPLDQAISILHRIGADTARKLWGLPLGLNIDSLIQVPDRKPDPQTGKLPATDSPPIPEKAEKTPQPEGESPKEPAPVREKPASAEATDNQARHGTGQAHQPSQEKIHRPGRQAESSEAPPAQIAAGASIATAQKAADSGLDAPRAETTKSASVPPESAIKPSVLTAELDKDRQMAIALAMRALRDELGLSRCMFATISRDMSELKARFVIGAEAEDALKKFHLLMKQRHIFSILMKEAKGFWLGGPNRDKYLPLIPNSLEQTLNMEGFVAASLFIDGLPLGMIYADPGQGRSMKETDFAGFKRVIRQLNSKLTPTAP